MAGAARDVAPWCLFGCLKVRIIYVGFPRTKEFARARPRNAYNWASGLRSKVPPPEPGLAASGGQEACANGF